ncbi:hypothetical protein llap_19092 [Limosa lapponica baueri]|uniref:Uncharacterized protein n=1 Tax=Limosa lapponica baueri TaxID=1758121 RepID=A0A2I0T9Y6_LIMLA|nr:hypothetical protein llap_19092 [Limosa lapponica baueri]
MEDAGSQTPSRTSLIRPSQRFSAVVRNVTTPRPSAGLLAPTMDTPQGPCKAPAIHKGAADACHKWRSTLDPMVFNIFKNETYDEIENTKFVDNTKLGGEEDIQRDLGRLEE